MAEEKKREQDDRYAIGNPGAMGDAYQNIIWELLRGRGPGGLAQQLGQGVGQSYGNFGNAMGQVGRGVGQAYSNFGVMLDQNLGPGSPYQPPQGPSTLDYNAILQGQVPQAGPIGELLGGRQRAPGEWPWDAMNVPVNQAPPIEPTLSPNTGLAAAVRAGGSGGGGVGGGAGVPPVDVGAVEMPEEPNNNLMTGGWRSLFNTPEGQMALMTLGTQLMQPIQLNESQSGNVGKAFQTSLGVLASGRQERKTDASRKLAESLKVQEGKQRGEEVATNRMKAETDRLEAGNKGQYYRALAGKAQHDLRQAMNESDARKRFDLNLFKQVTANALQNALPGQEPASREIYRQYDDVSEAMGMGRLFEDAAKKRLQGGK